jgi:hypothetical protein
MGAKKFFSQTLNYEEGKAHRVFFGLVLAGAVLAAGCAAYVWDSNQLDSSFHEVAPPAYDRLAIPALEE